MTLSIMSFSTMTLSTTIKIQHSGPSVLMLIVAMLNVIMMSVILINVVRMNAGGAFETARPIKKVVQNREKMLKILTTF